MRSGGQYQGRVLAANGSVRFRGASPIARGQASHVIFEHNAIRTRLWQDCCTDRARGNREGSFGGAPWPMTQQIDALYWAVHSGQICPTDLDLCGLILAPWLA